MHVKHHRPNIARITDSPDWGVNIALGRRYGTDAAPQKCGMLALDKYYPVVYYGAASPVVRATGTIGVFGQGSVA